MINFDRWSNRAIEEGYNELSDFNKTRADYELTIREGNGMYEKQPALPDMELEDFIGNMTVSERMDAKRRYLDEISDREKLCRLIDEANKREGADVELIN